MSGTAQQLHTTGAVLRVESLSVVSFKRAMHFAVSILRGHALSCFPERSGLDTDPLSLYLELHQRTHMTQLHGAGSWNMIHHIMGRTYQGRPKMPRFLMSLVEDIIRQGRGLPLEFCYKRTYPVNREARQDCTQRWQGNHTCPS